MATAIPEIQLQCCSCGSVTQGRQWHNRDVGYGICNKCSDWISGRESVEEMHSNYGVKGTHYYVSMEYSEIKQATQMVKSEEELCKVVEKADLLTKAGILKMTDENWKEFTQLIGEEHSRLSDEQ